MFILFYFCTVDYCLIQMFLALSPPLINQPWIIPELLLTLRDANAGVSRWQRGRKDNVDRSPGLVIKWETAGGFCPYVLTYAHCYSAFPLLHCLNLQWYGKRNNNSSELWVCNLIRMWWDKNQISKSLVRKYVFSLCVFEVCTENKHKYRVAKVVRFTNKFPLMSQISWWIVQKD